MNPITLFLTVICVAAAVIVGRNGDYVMAAPVLFVGS